MQIAVTPVNDIGTGPVEFEAVAHISDKSNISMGFSHCDKKVPLCQLCHQVRLKLCRSVPKLNLKTFICCET